MADLGVMIVVEDSGQIVLGLREDTEVWGLPGGAVDPGETVVGAAVREAREETGLEVRLVRLVGVYSRPARDAHTVTFLATPTGGSLKPQNGETLQVRFFDPSALPSPLVWWHEQPIRDALDGVGGGAVWLQDVIWSTPPEIRTRGDLYALRDRSGLSRREFYLRYLAPPGPLGERREI